MIAGVIGAFFIPEGQFASTWMVFGMIGGFCFIIIQLILIIDFAHSWAEKRVCKYLLVKMLFSSIDIHRMTILPHNMRVDNFSKSTEVKVVVVVFYFVPTLTFLML